MKDRYFPEKSDYINQGNDKKCLNEHKETRTPKNIDPNFTLKSYITKKGIKELFSEIKHKRGIKIEKEKTETKDTLDKLQGEIINNLDNKKLSNLSIEKRLKIIEQYLNSIEVDFYINMFFKRLENKITVLKIEGTNKTKRIKFTKRFIENHKKELKNNFKKLILMVIHIESDGNPLVKNKDGSSAIGLGQWLVGNGKKEKVYYYNKKWYRKEKLKELGINLNKIKRKKVIWLTSSWETKINDIWRLYPEKINEYIRWFPDNNITKPFKIKPFDIPWQEQIKILILGTLSGNRKNNEILMASLLGNQWGLTKFYKLYHTNPKIKTIKRINDISPKYIKQLKVIKP